MPFWLYWICPCIQFIHSLPLASYNVISLSLYQYTVTLDGHIVALKENPAVSKELLAEIHGWKLEGATDNDVLCRLRQRTVPTGYSYHFWCQGICTVALTVPCYHFYRADRISC